MLTVVIPSRNTSNFLRCARAVRQHEPSAHIVAIDDGLDDLGYRPELVPYLQCRTGRPFGFARNCNEGIRLAGSMDVVLLNDDALLMTPGGFTLLQREAEAHPQYGVIAATTNNVGNLNQVRRDGGGLRQDPRMVCFIAVLIPRRTIDLVGLLDEAYGDGYGFEDDEYCLRVREAGLRIGIHDGCFVDHASLPSSFRSRNFPRDGFARNQEIYRRRLHGSQSATA